MNLLACEVVQGIGGIMTVKWTIDMVKGVLVVRECGLNLFHRVLQRVPIARPKVPGCPEHCLNSR